MTRSNRRLLGMLPLVVAAGLLLASCGTEAGTAFPAGAVGADSSATGDTSQVLPTSVGGGSGDYDQNRTFALDMSVRVANFFVPKGSTKGTAVDVWVGSPTYGGKKLQTVPYGQVSPYFAPAVMDPQGAGQTDPHMSYTLNFYAAGKTGQDDLLIDQGENSSTGQKLTMAITPNEPNQAGASLQVFADDLGSDQKGSGFSTLSAPKAPTGKAVLVLNALAMEYLGKDPNQSDSLSATTPAGACITYIESDTGKVHDMNSDITEWFGGTSSQSYVVEPGTQVQITTIGDNTTSDDRCAGTTLIQPFDPKLAAGQRSYGFVYGESMKSAKLLLVPVG